METRTQLSPHYEFISAEKLLYSLTHQMTFLHAFLEVREKQIKSMVIFSAEINLK